ncbi:hypothetical protein F2Q70_00007136 [Brassica cretica]|uniref:Uncharacterized protein n=1 Tax=Brassica cretica TaxID=69181 RepID=A0A8S9M384_BRACR|nr:hypothetical protein F2Q70_00007136 [Brassica cretica]
MSSSMNVAKVKPLSFSRRLVPSAVSRGLSSSVTVSGYSGRSSAYAPSLRSIKCVSVSPEASIGTRFTLIRFGYFGFRKIFKTLGSKWFIQASARLTSVSLALLGLSALFSDVAFYWVVLIFFLQRGPIAPLAEEITEPEEKFVYLGILVLFLSLLVCLPYPFPFTGQDAMMIGL